MSEIERRINNFKAEHGRAISEREAWELFSKAENGVIPRPEFVSLFNLVISQQNPSVTLDQVVNVVTAKIDSIKDIELQYEAETVFTGTGAHPAGTRKQEEHFVLSKNKVFRRAKIKPESGSPPLVDFVLSHDGRQVVRIVLTQREQVVNIAPTFVDRTNPLSLSMLVDASSGFAKDPTQENLATFLSAEGLPPFVLYEELVPIANSKCYMLDNCAFVRLYLDANRNLSLVRAEFYTLDFGDPTKVKVVDVGEKNKQRLMVQQRIDCMGLRDYGNGIWLPQEIQKTNYQDGKTKDSATTKLISAVLNKGVSDEFFSDAGGLMPKDAIVADQTTGMVYKSDDRASIGDLLDETRVAPVLEPVWFCHKRLEDQADNTRRTINLLELRGWHPTPITGFLVESP